MPAAIISSRQHFDAEGCREPPPVATAILPPAIAATLKAGSPIFMPISFAAVFCRYCQLFFTPAAIIFELPDIAAIIDSH